MANILLTNVPVNESIEQIKNQLVTIGLPPDYPVLMSLNFWYEEFYEKMEGAAMGSPLSPVNANFHGTLRTGSHR